MIPRRGGPPRPFASILPPDDVGRAVSMICEGRRWANPEDLPGPYAPSQPPPPPAAPTPTTCSCGASVYLATTMDGGQASVDAAPSPDGTLALALRHGKVIAWQARPGEKTRALHRCPLDDDRPTE